MSSSRIPHNSRPKLAPRPASVNLEPKLVQLKSRITQIANNMRTNRDVLSSEISSTRSLKQQNTNSTVTLESCLKSNNLEQYLKTFNENQLTLEDLALLTKEDFVDMKIPIGPRNRIMKLAETLRVDKGGMGNKENCEERCFSRGNGKREDVREYGSEFMQSSYRSGSNRRSDSKEFLGEEDADGRMFGHILDVLKDIGEKQKIMAKAIEENRRAVLYLRKQSQA